MAGGERDYIAEQALDFQNRHFFGYNAAVHLEDAADELFWDKQLQRVKPGKYDYIYYSKSKAGNDTRGCEQCLRFKDYLNNFFFVCIDSDLRYLLKEPYMSAKNHIAQTYTYSWENHYCFAEALQKIWLNKCPDLAGKFDFQIFLKEYSNAVYISFMFLLFLKRQGVVDGFERSFNSILPKQFTRVELLQNGMPLVKSLSEKMNYLCLNHPLWLSFDLEKESRNITHSSLDSDNAYLFIRGHNVFDLLANIGKFICHGTSISFKDDILLTSLNEGCKELELVRADLEYIIY